MGEGDRGSAVRGRLRGIEVFAGPLAEFDPERAPADPVRLFPSWLSDAVAEPASARDDATDFLGRSDTARAESLPARRSQVEFWQAARGRVHTRLRHERAGDGWERFRLRS
ncbi:pyridoxine 5'-phosphate oxidase C-terminal domain-containing protein [Streptomyces virginiae]|uniref:pyridoxine 5'-phosphate oxidase C-terminal domain-containing protein n=1 Tax=Streptomyces virginiae TaxID=1961 RepID=UPI0036823096